MNEPTRGELGKARRALKKLGELNASEARQREIVDYFRAKGIDLTAHSSRYLANFIRRARNGSEPSPEKGKPFKGGKGNKYVRPDDPETSHEAAANLDIKGDEIKAFEFFERYYTENGITRDEFEELVAAELIAKNWDSQKAWRRAKSLRRRLTGLKEKGKIEVRYNAEGRLEKRDREDPFSRRGA